MGHPNLKWMITRGTPMTKRTPPCEPSDHPMIGALYDSTHPTEETAAEAQKALHMTWLDERPAMAGTFNEKHPWDL